MSNPAIQRQYELAREHHRLGRLREAEELYRQVISREPGHAEAIQMLGAIAFQSGHPERAIELMNRAIAIRPAAAEYHGNLAIVRASIGQANAAIDSLRQALAIRPDYPEALYNLGKLLAQQNQIDGAIAAYQQALRIQPGFAEACNNLGDLLRQSGRFDEAETFFRQALALRTGFPEALFNLGLALEDQDRLDDALAVLQDLLGRHPNHHEGYNALGNVLRELNRTGDALAAYRHAVELRPDFATALWHAGLCHLALGEFETGWRLYEFRRRLPDWQEPAFSRPQWDGSPPAGRRILLWHEQGFGDTIQFVRYAGLLAEQGASVSLRCQRPLARLLQSQPGLGQVIAEGDPLPEFDLHCPLITLPHLFNTSLETVPKSTPYIAANPADTARWGERILSLDAASAGAVRDRRMRVGLAWATNILPRSALKRWIDPAALARLAEVQDVTFFSLQKPLPGLTCQAGSRAQPAPPGLPLVDFTGDLYDFAETAALIENLDLIITCDTAVAHLAGAMGKTTWIAIPFAAPWRWMRDRNGSPWYPTVRLFRQSTRGDWASVVGQISRELRELTPPVIP